MNCDETGAVHRDLAAADRAAHPQGQPPAGVRDLDTQRPQRAVIMCIGRLKSVPSPSMVTGMSQSAAMG